MQLSDERASAILHVINRIPFGRLSTYGAIAAAAGFPGNARLVGNVLKRLPEDSTLPWFRVINAQGKISFPETSPNYHRQITALTSENHPFKLGKKHLANKMWP